MIEINLIPDVKQELIKAQRVRSSVVSISIIVGLGALGLVVILAVYVFLGQLARNAIVDSDINSQNEKLSKVEDLGNIITIQNQLTKLSSMHNDKKIDSRIFDVLSTIIPPEPNTVSVNKLTLDASSSTITLEAQASAGFPALEVFKKTISATKFQYKDGTEEVSVPLASDITDGSRTYGEDASGKKVLRFSLSFIYPHELFARSSKSSVIIAPTRTNVTDSFVGIPQSIFTDRATDVKGEGQ